MRLLLDSTERSQQEEFDVYFQSAPPEETHAVSGDHYKLCEFEAINTAREMIKQDFAGLTIRLLIEAGFGEDSENVAEQVMNGETVQANAAPCPFHMSNIYTYYRSFKGIRSYQCLLISAPGIGDNDERKRREEEMENFCCQAFPAKHFDRARRQEMILRREVSNSKDVENFVGDFFCRQEGVRAKNAIHAIIVFFGHGSPKGFVVGKEHIDLNKITLLVKEKSKRALLEPPGQLPVKVEIIFTQCYAHLHNEAVMNDRFRVTAFTTHERWVTYSILDEDGKFAIKELTKYATESLQKEVDEMVKWQSSDQAGFVDLSTGDKPTNENLPNKPADK